MRLLEFDTSVGEGLYKALLSYDADRWAHGQRPTETTTQRLVAPAKEMGIIMGILDKAIGFVVGMALVATAWGSWISFCDWQWAKTVNRAREAVREQQVQNQVAKGGASL